MHNQVLEYVKYNVNIIVNKIELCIENEERTKRHKESIKNHEEKIIKKLPYLKWSKFIQTNGINTVQYIKKGKKLNYILSIPNMKIKKKQTINYYIVINH